MDDICVGNLSPQGLHEVDGRGDGIRKLEPAVERIRGRDARHDVSVQLLAEWRLAVAAADDRDVVTSIGEPAGEDLGEAFDAADTRAEVRADDGDAHYE